MPTNNILMILIQCWADQHEQVVERKEDVA